MCTRIGIRRESLANIRASEPASSWSPFGCHVQTSLVKYLALMYTAQHAVSCNADLLYYSVTADTYGSIPRSSSYHAGKQHTRDIPMHLPG